MPIHFPSNIVYSNKYVDESYEYRHVILPMKVYERIIPGKLLTESEWRKLGIQGSEGWVHYLYYKPEPNVICLRKLKKK